MGLRSAIFFADEDYQFYCDTPRQVSQRFGCAIHAYVLMTNHVHLLITPDNERGPARMMQAVGRRYVSYINECYRRTGTLWEGRYKSTLIDSEHYLLLCGRYIELNPVRAGMVENPGQYRWSSYRCNAFGESNALITPHALYHALGSQPADQQAANRFLFETHIDTLRIAASKDWNPKEFMVSIDAHLRKSNDFTVIDLTGFTKEQTASVNKHLEKLAPDQLSKIIKVGF